MRRILLAALAAFFVCTAQANASPAAGAGSYPGVLLTASGLSADLGSGLCGQGVTDPTIPAVSLGLCPTFLEAHTFGGAPPQLINTSGSAFEFDSNSTGNVFVLKATGSFGSNNLVVINDGSGTVAQFDNKGGLTTNFGKTTNLTGLTLGSSGQNRIVSLTSGANPAFVLDAGAGTLPTGHFIDFETGPVGSPSIVAFVDINGNASFAGVLDSGLTASNCVGSDGSKNLVSNTNCIQSVAVTSPIGNSGSSVAPNFTCSTCVTTAGGQSIAGTTTFAGIIDSALTASTCVGSDGTLNLVSASNCVKSVAATSPLGNSGSGLNPNFTCSTCVTTAGGQSIAGTTTLNTLLLTNPLAIAQGGTGTTTPAIAASAPITQSGSWPNQTVACATCFTTAGGQSIAGQTTLSGTNPIVVSSNGVQTTIASNISSGSQTVTPAAMTGIVLGQSLLINTGGADAESVVTTTVGGSTFIATFAVAHTCPCTVKAGPSIQVSQTAEGGGLQIIPSTMLGRANGPEGALEITIPSYGTAATNVPYDLAFLGAQTGDTAKAQHQIYVQSTAASGGEDVMMILFGATANVGGSTQKCLTLNTAGDPSTNSTPSIDIFKCRGDFTAIGGNINANATGSGQGQIASGGAGVPTGAANTGSIRIGGGNTSNNTAGTQVGDCSGGNPCGGHIHQGTYFEDLSQNAAAQTCTGPFVCEFKSITTAPTSYKLTFQQSFTNKPFCQIVNYTTPAMVVTAITFTGSSPYTAVTFTVTGTTATDDVLINCGVGNGP